MTSSNRLTDVPPSRPEVDESPRYVSLRDYLRVLRESWLIVVALVLIAAIAAFAISKRQHPLYQATASVSYADDSYELGLLGTSVSPTSLPGAEGLQARAQEVTHPGVIAAVARAMHAQGGILPGSVSASVDQKTSLVDITGQAGDPRTAARLANLFATASAAAANKQAQQTFGGAAEDLKRQLKHVVGKGTDAAQTRASLIDQISRLDFLRSHATLAQVFSRAGVPGSPVSPKTTRNVLLAGLAGLLIALIIVFARDSLDRRLRGSQDVGALLDYQVVGRVRAEAMPTAKRNSPSNGSAASDLDREAFQIVRQNLGTLGESGSPRSMLVTSAVPEEGKSFVAASLAVAFASSGARTLLVECDLRRPVLAKRLGLEGTPGLADYLTDRATPQEVLQRVELGTSSASSNGHGPTPHELVCIVAGHRGQASPVTLLESERCGTFLRNVASVYDAVILDTTPLLAVADTLALLPNVDGVILCVRSGHTTRSQANAARETLERFPGHATGLVVTGLRARDEGDSYSYAYPSYV